MGAAIPYLGWGFEVEPVPLPVVELLPVAPLVEPLMSELLWLFL